MNRRSLLAGAGTGLSPLLVGCLGDDEAVPESKAERGRGEPLSVSTESSADDRRTDDRETHCLFEAGVAVLEAIESELETELESIDPQLSSDTGVEIALTTHLDRDENVVSSPNVEFDAVVDAAPESVTMTATIDGDAYDCEDSVTVRQVVSQDD